MQQNGRRNGTSFQGDRQDNKRIMGRERGSNITGRDRKSTRLNSSHSQISYAVFCLKKKKKKKINIQITKTNIIIIHIDKHILKKLNIQRSSLKTIFTILLL